jgi:hypothetical protein
MVKPLETPTVNPTGTALPESDGKNSVFDSLCAEASQVGLRAHARWDGTLFNAIAQGPGRLLWQAMAPEAHAPTVMRAYLKLSAEAVGAGYLDRASVEHFSSATKGALPDSANLLGRCWVQVLPRQLPGRAIKEQLELLAQVWNLCEGLLAEPAWLNRYVAAAAAELNELSTLPDFLVQTLEPALVPARASEFKGPFKLAQLDARSLDDEFLPGTMHLAAPAVLCLHDRRREGVHATVFLAPQGQCRFLGLNPCLGEGRDEGPLPTVEFKANTAVINGVEAELPRLGKHYRVAVARSGFVVTSALDSQRLWVLDCP